MAAKKPNNDQQKKFFDLIISGMDVAEAAREAEYERSYAYKLAKEYREYILEGVEGFLCLHAPRAAKRIIEGLDDDGTIAGTKVRMDAATTVLDRGVGLVKKEHIQVDLNAGNGIFILPAKGDAKEAYNNTDE